MFIKLHFTANTRMSAALRILADIINNQTVTSVAALQARFTANSYHASLTTNFDATNSMIVRTNAAANTSAHVAVGASAYASYQELYFTLRQPVYDSPSNFVFTQIRPSGSTSQNFFMDVGTLVTGGTITSSQVPLTFDEANSGSILQGTLLTLGGNNYGYVTAANATSSNGWDNLRTLWAYVTDKCFMLATTNGTSFPVGWGATYADSTKQTGPFIQTQYTRYDFHNTMNNNITPVMFSNQKATGQGLGTSGDLTAVQNILYTGGQIVPFRVHSMISAAPQVGTSWPRLVNQTVNLTVAGRTGWSQALNSAQVIGTQTSATSPTYAGALTTASSTRFPNSTLTGTGFAMLPWGWEGWYYGNHGGNASDQNGTFLFNGDYVPGDTFTFNNTNYMVWPLWSGFSNRVGLAVPMV